jgi:zinc transport system substrate-binding protein
MENIMKKTIITILLTLILLSGCSNIEAESDKPNVIVTLFPQYDMVRAIAKDKVNLELLLPAGVEPHSYEPTPNTIIRINESDLIVYTSDIMETWISNLFTELNDQGPIVVNSSNGVELITHLEEEHSDEEDHDEEYDPHFWLDPLNAKIMAENITAGLIEMDPENADFYQANANIYLSELDKLDQEFIDLFNRVKLNKIIYGGHFAFGYLSNRFNIEILSPYTGYSPDAEPSVSSLAELINVMQENQIKVIFYEELVDPKIARTISEQTGANIEVLHGAHNLSLEEMAQGLTYLDVMRSNIEKLKVALNYE